MRVEVIVPWAGNCVYRAFALVWVRARWAELGYDVTIAEGPAEPWCKGAVLYPAVKASTADVVVIADGDLWTADVAAGIDAVCSGDHNWAVPFGGVYRLDEAASAAVLAGEEPRKDMKLASKSYPAVPGGGLVVVRRDTYLEVPIDPRFLGWGYEDDSWGQALRLMAGPQWKSREPLFHLWHPKQPRFRHNPHHEANKKLYDRYKRAHRWVDRMEPLLAEARDACELGSPT